MQWGVRPIFSPAGATVYVPADAVVDSGIDVMWFGDGDGVGCGIDDSVGESCPLLYLCSAVYIYKE